jgi:hypothetical protein
MGYVPSVKAGVGLTDPPLQLLDFPAACEQQRRGSRKVSMPTHSSPTEHAVMVDRAYVDAMLNR